MAITALLLLAGCGTLDTDVTLYKEERWKAKIELYLLPGTVSMAGGESASESDMEDEVPGLREEGINLSWSKKRDNDGGV